MTSEILRLGQLLAYAEYQHGLALAESGRTKDHYDTAMLIATSRIEGKTTETAKRAYVLSNDSQAEKMKDAHTLADAELATWKGTRDALRASYDAVSRVVTIRQMELEMTRGVG